MSIEITPDIVKSSDSVLECLVKAHTAESIKKASKEAAITPEARDLMIDKFGVELEEVISTNWTIGQYNLDPDDVVSIERRQLDEALRFNAATFTHDYSSLLKTLSPKTKLADIIQFKPNSCWKNSAKKREFTKYKTLSDYITAKYTCRDLVYNAVDGRLNNLEYREFGEQVFDAFTDDVLAKGNVNFLLKHRHDFRGCFDRFILALAEQAILTTCEEIYKKHRAKINNNIGKPLKAALAQTRSK